MCPDSYNNARLAALIIEGSPDRPFVLRTLEEVLIPWFLSVYLSSLTLQVRENGWLSLYITKSASVSCQPTEAARTQARTGSQASPHTWPVSRTPGLLFTRHCSQLDFWHRMIARFFYYEVLQAKSHCEPECSGPPPSNYSSRYGSLTQSEWSLRFAESLFLKDPAQPTGLISDCWTRCRPPCSLTSCLPMRLIHPLSGLILVVHRCRRVNKGIHNQETQGSSRKQMIAFSLT